MTLDQTKTDIAERHGIPVTALRGDTPVELEAHATELEALGYSTNHELTAAEIVDRVTGKTSEVDDIIAAATDH